MAACKSLMTSSFVTQCVGSVSFFFNDSRSASPIDDSSASKTSIRLVASWLQKALQPPLCLHTAAVPTLPSMASDQSVHHIQTAAPTFASLSLAQGPASLFAAVSLLSATLLIAASFSW